MKKLILAIVFSLIVILPVSIMASSDEGLYRGVITVNNSSTGTTDVVAKFTADTASMQSNNFLNSNLSNLAIRHGATDMAFMPQPSSTNWWMFLPSVGAGTEDYSIYAGGENNLEGKLAYFPSTAGMTINDHTDLELGNDPFKDELYAYFDMTGGATKYALKKTSSFYLLCDPAGTIDANGALAATGISSGEHTIEVGRLPEFDLDVPYYLQVLDNIKLEPGSGDYTRSLWVYWDDVAHGYLFYHDTNTSNFESINYVNIGTKHIQWVIYSSGSKILDYSANFTPSNDTWYNFICRRSGTTWTIYINGISQGDVTANITVPNFTGHNYYGGGYTPYFDGRMADIRYLNRAISDTEITEYQSKVYSNNTGLQNYLKCDDGTGTTLHDSSSNDLDGIANSCNWVAGMSYLSVDGVVEDTGDFGEITGNSNDWVVDLNYALPYVYYYKHSVNGTLYSDIECATSIGAGETTFSDQSGHGHTATPAFRSTASDADVTATLTDLRPIDPAKLSSMATSTGSGDATNGEILDATPSVIAQMYTELDTSAIPGADAVNEILAESDTPEALWWFPFIFILIVILGMLVFDATQRNGGDGSLLAEGITIEALLVLFGVIGTANTSGLIPFFPAILFPIPMVALILSRKHLSWG